MKMWGVIFVLCASLLWAQETPLTRIAFGSCSHQDHSQPIWQSVIQYKPELFVFLGDNIYGDTVDMDELCQKYQKLAQKPGFAKLRETTNIIATWDDHDYGENDAGYEYPMKQQSKEIFLDFFQEPQDSPRRKHAGIYHSYLYGPPGKVLQIILLDLRFFRSPLLYKKRDEERKKLHMGGYVPNFSPEATMLGEEQWQWLKKQFKVPAQIRIIASSTQFLVDFNGWEAWINLPNERENMLRLIEETRTEGVFFISGDTHWAEFSRLKRGSLYPIYDITSSGLTEVWDGVAPNKNRIGEPFLGQNFGTITIAWEKNPVVTVEIRDVVGKTQLQRIIKRDELNFDWKE